MLLANNRPEGWGRRRSPNGAEKEETMFKGKTVLKAISAAIIITTAAAPMASAGSTQFFGFNNIGNSYISDSSRNQPNEGRATLRTVRADGPGVVEVYTYHAGRVGQFLGSRRVHEGANSRVRINFRRTGLDAIAILKVNGQIVDTQRLDY